MEIKLYPDEACEIILEHFIARGFQFPDPDNNISIGEDVNGEHYFSLRPLLPLPTLKKVG